ncbi:MAG: hypothetical protein C4550_05000 [Nitrospiraceae bacterium]|nr:MAG: hypothetical protein C4550_05000 [Nitrospiraceae bacterium]
MQWNIEFSVPFNFIEEYYGKTCFKPGKVMNGNFYKYGDDTLYPHYGCWNEVFNPIPDFHRPECFGYLVLK